MMQTDIGEWRDYAEPALGDCLGEDADDLELLDFRTHGISDFGIYADNMGMCGGMGMVAEVDIDELGRAWTPILELKPKDYNYIRRYGRPKHNMTALGDNMQPYIYDENLGFFKKLWRKAKKVRKKIRKGVSKFARRLKKVGKAILKRIPGGKYVLKLGKKLWKITKKLVGPLMKVIGPIAKKLAPIAAMIPGYGTAVAAALHTTGRIAEIMKKTKATFAIDKATGISRLAFKNPKKVGTLKKLLEKEAKKVKKQIARGKSKARRSRPKRRRLSRARAIA